MPPPRRNLRKRKPKTKIPTHPLADSTANYRLSDFIDLRDWFQENHHSSVIENGFFVTGGLKYINLFPSNVPQVEMSQPQYNMDGTPRDWIFVNESNGPFLQPKNNYIRGNVNDMYQCSWDDYLSNIYIHDKDCITHF